MTEKEIRNKIVSYLQLLNVSPNLNGYTYICEAIWQALNDWDYILHFTKKMYPFLANKYNTTIYGVETAIRYAISSADIDKLPVLTNTKGKLTNSKFISLLASEMDTTLF